jgi:hypothetical protein
MRFSLRALVIILTLIATVLGTREAIKLYHWHRHIPVVYHLAAGDTAGFPNELIVEFDRQKALKTKELARKQQKAFADEVFSDHAEVANFWIRRSVSAENLQRFQRRYGVGQQSGKHLQPFEPLYSVTYSPAVRAHVDQKNRDSFLSDPGIAKISQQRLLANWLASKDPQAAAWLTDQLKTSDQDTRNMILGFLGSGNIILPESSVVWLAEHSRFRNSILSLIHDDSDLQDPVFRVVRRLKIRAAATKIQSMFDRITIEPAPKKIELDSQWMARVQNKLKLLAHLTLLRPDSKTLEDVEAVGNIISGVCLHHEVSPLADADQFHESQLHKRIRILVNSLTWSLRTVGRTGDEAVKVHAAELAYRWNLFNLFLELAGPSHEAKVTQLFRLRKSLCYKEFFVDFYAKTFGDFSPAKRQAFYAELPSPETGFEEMLLVENLANAAVRVSDETAKQIVRQLALERIDHAVLLCGKLFEGTEEPELIQFLEKELRDNGERAKAFEERFKKLKAAEKPMELAQFSGAHDGGPFGFISQRMSVQQIGKIPKLHSFQTLRLICPGSASSLEQSGQYVQPAPALPNHFDEPESLNVKTATVTPSWGAFNRLLQKHGFEINKQNEEPYRDMNYWTEVLEAFIKAKRYSFVSKVTKNEALLVDVIVNASREHGFHPEAALVELGKRKELQISLPDRVHLIPTSDREATARKTTAALCDVLNHIVDRQNIEDRFVVVPSSLGEHVLFGHPEMFRELMTRYNTGLANAEYYLGLEPESQNQPAKSK